MMLGTSPGQIGRIGVPHAPGTGGGVIPVAKEYLLLVDGTSRLKFADGAFLRLASSEALTDENGLILTDDNNQQLQAA